MSRPTTVTAAAGEFYIAFQCSLRGFVVAIPRANVPSVDLLVSNTEGSQLISVQVKTSGGAFRPRKDPSESRYEFDVGEKGKHIASPKLFYAFVDLNWQESTPRVFVVPSADVHAFFNDGIDRKRYMIWLMDSEKDLYLDRWTYWKIA